MKKMSSINNHTNFQEDFNETLDEHDIKLLKKLAGFNLAANCKIKIEKENSLYLKKEEDKVKIEENQFRNLNEKDKENNNLKCCKKQMKRKPQFKVEETQEQRQYRLLKMKEYQRKRIASETKQQRRHRLKKLREYQARKLAKESPNERSLRLARMRAYALSRQLYETPKQRHQRLFKASKRLTREKKENRLLKMIEQIACKQLTKQNSASFNLQNLIPKKYSLRRNKDTLNKIHLCMMEKATDV